MQNDTPNFPNWFVGQQYNFENHLDPSGQQPNLTFLQIGVYTLVMPASGYVRMYLRQKTSFLYDVDTWKGSAENLNTSKIDFDQGV
jgi:hypothetical protein